MDHRPLKEGNVWENLTGLRRLVVDTNSDGQGSGYVHEQSTTFLIDLNGETQIRVWKGKGRDN